MPCRVLLKARLRLAPPRDALSKARDRALYQILQGPIGVKKVRPFLYTLPRLKVAECNLCGGGVGHPVISPMQQCTLTSQIIIGAMQDGAVLDMAWQGKVLPGNTGHFRTAEGNYGTEGQGKVPTSG